MLMAASGILLLDFTGEAFYPDSTGYIGNVCARALLQIYRGRVTRMPVQHSNNGRHMDDIVPAS